MAQPVPFKVSATLEILAWGELIDLPDYAKPGNGRNAHTVVPNGYKAKCVHVSGGESATYVCSARTGEVCPVFSVVEEDKADTDAESVGASATNAFLACLSKANPDRKHSVNGLGKFGLSNDKVLAQLKRLPGGTEIFAKLDAAAKAKEDAIPPLVTRGAVKKARDAQDAAEAAAAAEVEGDREPASKRQKLENGEEKAIKSKPSSRAGSQVRAKAETPSKAAPTAGGGAEAPASGKKAKAPAKPRTKKSAGDDARGKRNRDGEVDADADAPATEGEGNAPAPKKAAARKPRAKKGDAAADGVVDPTSSQQPEGGAAPAPTEKKERAPRVKKDTTPVLDADGNIVPPKEKKERVKKEPVLDEDGNVVRKERKAPVDAAEKQKKAEEKAAADAKKAEEKAVADAKKAEEKEKKAAENAAKKEELEAQKKKLAEEKEAKKAEALAEKERKATEKAALKAAQPRITNFLKKGGQVKTDAEGNIIIDGTQDAAAMELPEEPEEPRIVVLPPLDRNQRTKARSQYDLETVKRAEAGEAATSAKKDDVPAGVDDDEEGAAVDKEKAAKKLEREAAAVYPEAVKSKQAKRRYLQFQWSFMSEKSRMDLNKRFIAANGKDAVAPEEGAAGKGGKKGTAAGGKKSAVAPAQGKGKKPASAPASTAGKKKPLAPKSADASPAKKSTEASPAKNATESPQKTVEAKAPAAASPGKKGRSASPAKPNSKPASKGGSRATSTKK